jgi:hypothetical protein
MPRAVAIKENGRAIVLVDVETYGGDKLSIGQAVEFNHALVAQINEAKRIRAEFRE